MSNIGQAGDQKPASKLQYYLGLVVVVLLVLFCNSARGQQNVTFGWTPESDPTISGYILHFGSASGNYTTAIDVGLSNTVTVSNLSLEASLFFSVTSYDTNGMESIPSSEAYLGPTISDFMKGHVSYTNGIDFLVFPDGNLFGYYGWLTLPWFYHMDLGYEYLFDAQDGQGSVYLWDFASGSWWYTNPQIFPIIYDFSLNAWIYYYPDKGNPTRYTSSPRQFYNYATKQKFSK